MLTVPHDGRWVPTLHGLTTRSMFDVDFAVDVVYSWQPRAAGTESTPDHDLLLYSLRALAEFMPWVRNVVLVTEDPLPDWLDRSRVRVVRHKELFGRIVDFPTDNYRSTDARIHRIEGLSEHYIHFRPNFFISRPASPDFFYYSNGVCKVFLSRGRLAPSSSGEPTTAAAAQVRAANLLCADFGRMPVQRFVDAPMGRRRSVLFELEDRYPEAFESTWTKPTAAGEDFDIHTLLHHYYGYLTGRAVPGRIRFDRVDLSEPWGAQRMLDLTSRREHDAFRVVGLPAKNREAPRRALSRLGFAPSEFER